MQLTKRGSSEHWGAAWGRQPEDWDELERQQAPTYEAVLDRLDLPAGSAVLDVGCGAGAFLRIAADRRLEAAGLDASESLVQLAEAKVPGADLRVGEMEDLPWKDDSFDLVTGFNSFFFATDIVHALSEAKRVARAGAPVVVQVWGDPLNCELTAMKGALARFLPPSPPSPALWQPGVLEDLLRKAGLEPREAFDIRWAYEFADEEALGRAMLAPGNVALAVASADEDEVRRAIVTALTAYRTSEGGFRIANEWHVAVASS